jgi:hypothetical protein
MKQLIAKDIVRKFLKARIEESFPKQWTQASG